MQARRLIGVLQKDATLTVAFQAIGPKPPAPFGFMTKIKGLRTLVTLTRYVWELLWRVPRYDVLHVFSAAHSAYVLWAVPALAVAKLYGKRIILNYRDGRADDHLSRSAFAVKTIRRMDAVVAPSDFLVDVFANHGLKAISISNILDPSAVRYRARRDLKPVFLHNRMLEPLYNVPCTLRAFQLIQQRYPDASLTLAHDGRLRDALEALARQLNLKNTRFIGVVPHAQIAALYDSADVCLMSPDVDNMPGSVLECFAAGLPVVATNVGGIPYIATDGQTALLVPKGDHEAMARAAVRFLSDPDLVERVTKNAHESCSRYAEGPVRNQWSALYRRLHEQPLYADESARS